MSEDREIEPFNERQRRYRADAFREFADPLYFQWQAGEGTEQDWLDMREAIRMMYPYEEVPTE